MALREIKDRIEREREPESESPSRLASHKRRKKPTQQLFCEMPQSSGQPPTAAGAGFQPPSSAPEEDPSRGYQLPRRARNAGYRAPGYGGRGRGGRSSFASMVPRGESFAFSPSTFPSSCPLPPPPATPEERIDQLLDRISPTEETDAARAAVFAFLRSVVNQCFSECKVREKETTKKTRTPRKKNKLIDLSPLVGAITRPSFDPWRPFGGA